MSAIENVEIRVELNGWIGSAGGSCWQFITLTKKIWLNKEHIDGLVQIIVQSVRLLVIQCLLEPLSEPLIEEDSYKFYIIFLCGYPIECW